MAAGSALLLQSISPVMLRRRSLGKRWRRSRRKSAYSSRYCVRASKSIWMPTTGLPASRQRCTWPSIWRYTDSGQCRVWARYTTQISPWVMRGTLMPWAMNCTPRRGARRVELIWPWRMYRVFACLSTGCGATPLHSQNASWSRASTAPKAGLASRSRASQKRFTAYQ